MDKVRFGRALGKGARGASKSLWEAASAVAAPDPSPKLTRPAAPPPQATASRPDTSRPLDLREAADRVMKAHQLVTDTKRQMRDAAIGAAKESGKGVLAPVKKFSSVLWLEVTGTFFAFITLFLLQGVWTEYKKLGGNLNSPAGHKFIVYAVVSVLFSYFTVSSFVRARQRGKRR
jgi:hypothetical protein